MERIMLNIGERPAIDTIAKTLGQGLIGAEVGVNKGYNAMYICTKIRPSTLYLIDPWNNFFDPASGEIIGEVQYLMTKQHTDRFGCCKIIRDTSFNAVKQFENESLDFVYIDSDHSYTAVFREAMQWYSKVKKGGIFSGHDFSPSTPEVISAITDFCRGVKIKQLCNQAQDWWFIK